MYEFHENTIMTLDATILSVNVEQWITKETIKYNTYNHIYHGYRNYNARVHSLLPSY